MPPARSPADAGGPRLAELPGGQGLAEIQDQLLTTQDRVTSPRRSPRTSIRNVRRVKRVSHDPGVSGEAVPMWIATVRNGSVLIISDSARCAAPYANRQTRAMREKVEILERAGQMVLAAHRTPSDPG
jgi:hypothetical protein